MRDGAAVGAGGGPRDFAGGVGFLFPDGDAGLDGVDEEAVGVKGGFAMGRGGQRHDGAVADGEGADAVDGEGLGDGEFLHRLGEDALAFLGGENRMVGVVELFDVAAFVMVSNEAFEDDECSASGIGHLSSEGGEIDFGILDFKHGLGVTNLRQREA